MTEQWGQRLCVSVCVCTHLSENLCCSSGRCHWDSALREDKNRITVFLSSLQIIARQISWTFPSPVTRGNVALLGLGLSGGRCAVLSCVAVLFLLALDRLSRVFLPVSGSLWMNFFSTYFERIQDSLSPLRHSRYSMYLNNWKSAFLYFFKVIVLSSICLVLYVICPLLSPQLRLICSWGWHLLNNVINSIEKPLIKTEMAHFLHISAWLQCGVRQT